ncbi:MAG TPA: helix-turn-helix domain-containing protein [Planctomycetota bacterium]|nr:helix-turn-helix domain-containing protein [Planctomycetota bacterium]
MTDPTPAEPTKRDLPRLLTLPEVVKLTGRCVRSLYTDIAMGRLRVTKLGKSVRVAEADYLAYLEQGRKQGTRRKK